MGITRGSSTIVACVILAAATVVAAGEPQAGRRFQDRGDELHRLLQEIGSDDEPGFAVTVLHGDETVFSRSYGLADLAKGTPIDENTRFYVASVAKSLTATAVLLLHQDGELPLETPIRTWFGELPEFADRITVYHLLTHTSGLPDYYDLPAGRVPNDNRSVLEYVRRIEALEFEPGVDYAYSNTGYVLLAEIVERVSGRKYADFLERRIFAPLGMTQTSVYDVTRPTVPHRAVGYRKDEGSYVEDDYRGVTTTGPGGVFSTTRDIARWYVAIHNHEILDERTTELQFHMPYTLSGSRSWIAMGWFNETFGSKTPDLAGVRALGAIGMLDGFRAILKFFPDDDLAYIVLSNSSRLPVGGDDIARLFLPECSR